MISFNFQVEGKSAVRVENIKFADVLIRSITVNCARKPKISYGKIDKSVCGISILLSFSTTEAKANVRSLSHTLE